MSKEIIRWAKWGIEPEDSYTEAKECLKCLIRAQKYLNHEEYDTTLLSVYDAIDELHSRVEYYVALLARYGITLA